MGDILSRAPQKKRSFKTVQEAKSALANDKLGCVYISSKGVFVITAFGSGHFTIKEWRT